ncbi:MAG: site-specific integrase [Actinomycetes bacterium]
MLVKDYVPLAMGAMAENTRKGWATYARRIVEVWGERDMSTVLSTEIEAEARQVQDKALRRAVSISGAGARDGFISCARAVWRRAVADGVCDSNPASKVKKPVRRAPAGRRALNPEELGVVQGVLANSKDPDLALVVFRLCLETGCRRNELLGLRVRDLARSAYGWTATLDTGAKLGSKRSLPITADLAAALSRLGEERIGPDWRKRPDERLLRNKRRQPITHRWLEDQSKKVRAFNPALGSTTEVFFTWHVLRHTAASLVERAGGFATAQAFLGHSPTGGSATAITLAYTKPSTEELRAVHTRIWDRPENWSPAGADDGLPF